MVFIGNFKNNLGDLRRIRSRGVVQGYAAHVLTVDTKAGTPGVRTYIGAL